MASEAISERLIFENFQGGGGGGGGGDPPDPPTTACLRTHCALRALHVTEGPDHYQIASYGPDK